MQHFELDHNTEEWYLARAGVATSSSFDKILTKTGKLSAQSEAYANGLVAELVLGRATERDFSTYAMDWGHEHEGDAVDLYSFETALDIEGGGFYTNEQMTVGASPDARVYDKGILVGLAEIKCPENPANHIEYLLMQEMNPKYIPQVQGQLFVSELEWVDWFSYYPGMPSARIRTHRDEKYLQLLSSALDDFQGTMNTKINRLIELGYLDKWPTKEIHVPEKKETLKKCVVGI